MKKTQKKYKISKTQSENLKYLRDQLLETEKKGNTKDINLCKNMIDKYLDDIINS